MRPVRSVRSVRPVRPVHGQKMIYHISQPRDVIHYVTASTTRSHPQFDWFDWIDQIGPGGVRPVNSTHPT